MHDDSGKERDDDDRSGLIMSPSIEAYFARRRQHTVPVRLYALFDGVLYQDRNGTVPDRTAACLALLDDTPDESVANAGPWLVDCEATSMSVSTALSSLAASSLGVSWLISAYPMTALADHLRANLDVELPDGQLALLRFHDARLMPSIASVMTPVQRLAFFVTVFDWLVEYDGHLIEIARNAHPI